jgi:hypothetical protein
MTNQRVFDSAIANRTYCGRAVSNVTANGSNNVFLVHPDGNLYCLATLTGFDLAQILQSADNGFTWEPVTNSAWGSDTAHLIDVTYRSYDNAEGLIQGIWKNSYNGDFYFLTNVNGQFWFYRCSDQTYNSFYGEVTVKYGLFNDLANSIYFASTGDGDTLVYVAYINTNNDLKMLGLDISLPLEYIPQDYVSYGTTNWVSGLLAVKSKDSIVHTLAVMNDIPDMLCYCPYTKKQGGGTGHFSGYYQISSGTFAANSSSHIDLAIDVDKQNNICAVYSTRDSDPGTSAGITGYYAISNDNGVTWTSVYNTPPAGYSGYVDPMTSKVTLYNDVIGGASGSFLLSSVYMQNNSGTLFVKEVSSTVIPVGASTDSWYRVNTVDGKVIGGKFFKYMAEAIPEFGDKSSVRLAYQMGELNNNYGADTVKSRIYQERLTNLAFPQSYSGTAFTKDDIDYYASGYINENTALYITKIDELGMEYSFSRYDPSEDSEIIGIGAYGQPTTFEAVACVDPGSYGFATVARNNSDFSDYIERDTRKIFYKPNLFLERNFIINKGGYLKRTIYTVRIMGNDYELAQIVPRFLDGSILYYEANLYVIGPSNDPFKKVILPSES